MATIASRIYYTDALRFEFDATVINATPDGNGRWRVILDQTAFYPTSGGQPFDTGRLDDVSVVDVVDTDDGLIEHVTDGPLTVGRRVQGSIDRERRLDHRQQHTAQHLLSAAFDRLLDVRTVSFHLGAASATADLAREVTPAEIAAAEAEANRIVWEDRPVTVRFASAEDAAAMPLRKESARQGDLRLIEVEDYDLSACGGTHVSRTGEIGIIAVSGWERFRGGTRIEFVSGRRALIAFHELRDSVTSAVRMLSVLPSELPAAVERLQAESKDLRRQVRDASQKLIAFDAAALAQAAEPRGEAPEQGRAVIRVLDGYDAAGLKALASAIIERPGLFVGLFSKSTPVAAVIARSPNVRADCAALFKGLAARFGGKGGGRPEFAQGGGLTGSPDDIASALREAAGGA